MLIGARVLDDLGVTLDELTHISLDRVREGLTSFPELYNQALLEVRVLLSYLGIDENKSSLQKLSATFRRGDLLTERKGKEAFGRGREASNRDWAWGDCLF